MYEKQGEKIKQLRKSFNYTLEFVSSKLDITINYLSLIERGERKPSETVMYKMAEFYNLNPIDIFSLYGIIPTDQIEKIISCPSLVKILANLNEDDRLTEEEKAEISNILQQETLKILNKRKG